MKTFGWPTVRPCCEHQWHIIRAQGCPLHDLSTVSLPASCTGAGSNLPELPRNRLCCLMFTRDPMARRQPPFTVALLPTKFPTTPTCPTPFRSAHAAPVATTCTKWDRVMSQTRPIALHACTVSEDKRTFRALTCVASEV